MIRLPVNRHRLWQVLADAVLIAAAWRLTFYFRFDQAVPVFYRELISWRVLALVVAAQLVTREARDVEPRRRTPIGDVPEPPGSSAHQGNQRVCQIRGVGHRASLVIDEANPLARQRPLGDRVQHIASAHAHHP